MKFKGAKGSEEKFLFESVRVSVLLRRWRRRPYVVAPKVHYSLAVRFPQPLTGGIVVCCPRRSMRYVADGEMRWDGKSLALLSSSFGEIVKKGQHP